VEPYPALPLILPVMSALAGNVGCIFASRLSTSLHAGYLHEKRLLSRENLVVMGTLFCISLPIHLAYLGFTYLTRMFSFSVVFLLAYLFTGAVSVVPRKRGGGG
jgi:solute carrier family 41